MARLPSQLYVQMIVGIVSGTVIGHYWPTIGTALAPLGVAFVKAMRMMVPPILFCTIVDGIVAHGGARRTGSTIARALVVFVAITIAALFAGVAVTALLHPGAGLAMSSAPPPIDVARLLGTRAIDGPGDFLLRLVPDTFFSAFTAGDVLPVLFIAGLVGFGLLKIGTAGEPIVRAVRGLMQLQFVIFGFLIRAAPIGALGAVAFTVGTYGIGFIGSLGMFAATLILASSLLLGALALIVRLWTRLPMLALVRHFREELLIILGTSSSEVVLPRIIRKLEALGTPQRLVGLVVPLGYTLNLAGTAVYLMVSVLFLSEAMGITLPLNRLLVYFAVMLATSKTAAGVTGSGFSALLLTLSLLPDIPVGAAAMLIAVDRFLSIARAMTSVGANIAATLIVARWSGVRLTFVKPPVDDPAMPPSTA